MANKKYWPNEIKNRISHQFSFLTQAVLAFDCLHFLWNWWKKTFNECGVVNKRFVCINNDLWFTVDTLFTISRNQKWIVKKNPTKLSCERCLVHFVQHCEIFMTNSLAATLISVYRVLIRYFIGKPPVIQWIKWLIWWTKLKSIAGNTLAIMSSIHGNNDNIPLPSSVYKSYCKIYSNISVPFV